jgi:arginase family enzyme
LSTRQALDILHSLKAKVVGLDVVELNPTRDPAGITAAAAVKIIKETAGMMAKKGW